MRVVDKQLLDSLASSNNLYLKLSDVELTQGTILNRFRPRESRYVPLIRAVYKQAPECLPYLAMLGQLAREELAESGLELNLLGNSVVEAIFQEVRLACFPALPDRLESVHLFRSIEAAELFGARFRSSGRLWVYTCNIGNGIPFHTHMDWINRRDTAPPSNDFTSMTAAIHERAVAYWSGQVHPDAHFPETLVDGTVTVSTLVARSN